MKNREQITKAFKDLIDRRDIEVKKFMDGIAGEQGVTNIGYYLGTRGLSAAHFEVAGAIAEDFLKTNLKESDVGFEDAAKELSEWIVHNIMTDTWEREGESINRIGRRLVWSAIHRW